MKKINLTILAITIFSSSVFCQIMTQTIRGAIIDADSKMPLIGATIIIVDSDPIIGVTTDLDGIFKFKNIPIGRKSLTLSYLGYESKTVPNIVATSTKEVVLNLEMQESLVNLQEVVICPKQKNGEPINEMAMISARSISVEETNRYAGTADDPARMVSSYAGVTNNPLGNNEIIVRGNSPQGVLWRLEGVEIPNPNHFSREGATGGPISALNSNMLANSDFYTGAFSPEYGNATSGVFDMKLRKGNNEKREYSLGVNVLGTDITAEGPFSRNYSGSYLANYRYSTLGLLAAVGIVEYGGIPKYQDASFNMHLPTKNAGVFSLFGLGGLSGISEEVKDEENVVFQKSQVKSSLGVIGLTHSYFVNDKTYIKSCFSLAGSELDGAWDVLSDENGFYKAEEGVFSKHTSKFTSIINNKINAKNSIKTGVIYTNYSYNYTYNTYNIQKQQSEEILNNQGNSGLLQAFSSWKHRFNEKLSLNTGFHYTHFMLNNSNTIEPRFALKWKYNPNQSITLGYGQHSRIEALSTYLANVNGQESANKGLELTKARHFVLGYDNSFSKNMIFKTEIYYQDLFDVPVANDVNNSFSTLNQMDGMPEVDLINEGRGENYGIELSLEKFFADNYYFLMTSSFYESKYSTLDGISRETVWNGQYAFNALGGKEFVIGDSQKGRVLFTNAKVSCAGGGKYHPVDIVASRITNKTVLKEEFADSDDFVKVDFSIGMKFNRKNTTHEIKMEVLNATNNSAIVKQYYNSAKDEVVNNTQLPLLPVISYKMNF